MISSEVVSDSWFANQCVRLSINMKSNDCGDNADCSGKGLCFSNSSMVSWEKISWNDNFNKINPYINLQDGYECFCFANYVGSHCEEIDACLPSNPCENSGICIDYSQGHNGNKFQCLCPYGENWNKLSLIEEPKTLLIKLNYRFLRKVLLFRVQKMRHECLLKWRPMLESLGRDLLWLCKRVPRKKMRIQSEFYGPFSFPF